MLFVVHSTQCNISNKGMDGEKMGKILSDSFVWTREIKKRSVGHATDFNFYATHHSFSFCKTSHCHQIYSKFRILRTLIF